MCCPSLLIMFPDNCWLLRSSLCSSSRIFVNFSVSNSKKNERDRFYSSLVYAQRILWSFIWTHKRDACFHNSVASRSQVCCWLIFLVIRLINFSFQVLLFSFEFLHLAQLLTLFFNSDHVFVYISYRFWWGANIILKITNGELLSSFKFVLFDCFSWNQI